MAPGFSMVQFWLLQLHMEWTHGWKTSLSPHSCFLFFSPLLWAHSGSKPVDWGGGYIYLSLKYMKNKDIKTSEKSSLGLNPFAGSPCQRSSFSLEILGISMGTMVVYLYLLGKSQRRNKITERFSFYSLALLGFFFFEQETEHHSWILCCLCPIQSFITQIAVGLTLGNKERRKKFNLKQEIHCLWLQFFTFWLSLNLLVLFTSHNL